MRHGLIRHVRVVTQRESYLILTASDYGGGGGEAVA
jgi:hypothetical protein